MVGVSGSQDLLWTRTNKIAVREVHPTNCAIRVQEKFGGTRNVGVIGTARVGMHQVPLANDVELLITKKQKRVASRLAKIFGFGWAVDTDRDHTNSA